MPNDSALLIGVDDYSAYDASQSSPPGTSHLQGSLNDVRAWVQLCREIGIKNLRVLTSPALSPDEQPGADCRAATAQEIRDGVAWLAEQLGTPLDTPEAERPVGLLTYSGHGDQTTNEGLVICPTDVTAAGTELVNAVSLEEIQRVIARANAEPNLTVVLDCCHDGGGTGRDAHQVTSLRPLPLHPSPPLRPRLGGRMLCAAAVGEPAYQADFGVGGSAIHGAFTWAFLTVKNRWTLTQQGDSRELSISYRDLRDATRDLLRALDFDQSPELDCVPGAAPLPLFHRGPTAAPGETSETPNGQTSVTQCDPGLFDYRLYTFMQGSTHVADMLVVHNADPLGRYSIGTEYWFMDTVPSGRVNTTVSMVDRYWSTAPPSPRSVDFRMNQAVTWSNSGPTLPPVSNLACNPGGTIGIQWQLTHSSSGWGGSIIWSQSTPSSGNYNALFAGTPATQTLTIVTTVPSTLGHCATVTPR